VNNTNKAGDTVAYRSDGYTLIYDYEDKEGFSWGHMVKPDGSSAKAQTLVSVLAHGYWKSEPNG